MGEASAFLDELLASRLDERQSAWLEKTRSEIAAGVEPARFASLISLASRFAPRTALEPTAEECAGASACVEGWNPERWRALEAVRVALVLAHRGLAGDEGVAVLDGVFQYADQGEQCALFRSLALLEDGERFAWRASDGCRTNIVPVFESIACDTPYPLRHFDDIAWRQLAIKAVFIDAPLWRVFGLDQRLSDELARMALDLADERRSAGRPVQHELWLCLGPHGGERAAESLERELASSNTLGRRAAAIAMARGGQTDRLRALAEREADPDVAATMREALEGNHDQYAFRLSTSGVLEMRFFDPHIHMTSRTTDDLESMAASGVRAVVEPAFWLGQPRTTVGAFVDYFSSLVGWERFRASQFGIQHYCAIGLNSKEANNEGLAREVLELLPRYALKEGVVAVGEIGYDEITPAEERAYKAQLQFAVDHDMVVMVHSPHRDKKRGIIRSLDVAQEVGVPMEKLVIDHNNEETVEDTLNRGAWAAFTIYPHTKMGSERMVEIVKKYGPERIIVDSSADWGVSDPLSVPKTAKLMLESGVDPEWVRLTTWQNALDAYAQSGQIDVDALLQKPVIDQSQLFADNSVLRGQKPRVDVAVPN